MINPATGRHVLPSFNYGEFVAHIEKGPGFGCWDMDRVKRTWSALIRGRRATARDMAKLYLSSIETEKAEIMVAMLDEDTAREMLAGNSTWQGRPTNWRGYEVYWALRHDPDAASWILKNCEDTCRS